MDIGAHEVVIVGGGPTGLMLAGELALQGIDVGIVEQRPDQTVEGARAGGLNARTLETLEQRGIADRFLAEGKPHHVAGFAWIHFKLGELPSRHPNVLGLWQKHVERILAGWVEELGAPVHRGRTVVGVAQDGAGVQAELDGGDVVRGLYLVGCDGGRSAVRKAAGIGFPGFDATISNLIAEVELEEEADWGLKRNERGLFAIGRMEDGKGVRTMVTEPAPGRAGEPTLDDLKAAMLAGFGSDYGVHSPAFISRFTDAARQADAYRKGRVLLAGDAAHIHYPVGGQGLNLGVQDAANLGWKLAQVVRGTSPEALLDTYQAERHPVAARVLRDTMAQVALLRASGPHGQALYDAVAELLGVEEAQRLIAGRMTGLDIRYELGGDHPLVGRRMPDLDLATGEGPVRASRLLHAGRGVLLDLGGADGFDSGPWAERVRRVQAQYDGPWELPLIGAVEAPDAMLIRPDGYVAWAGGEGLAEAMTTWFGTA